MNDHDIPIKAYLTADEFIAFRNLCAVHGLSQSSYIRQMIKRDIASAAMEKLQREGFLSDSNKTGINQA